MDVGTKYIIAGLLVRFLKAAGYFEKDEVKSSEILIGKYSRPAKKTVNRYILFWDFSYLKFGGITVLKPSKLLKIVNFVYMPTRLLLIFLSASGHKGKIIPLNIVL